MSNPEKMAVLPPSKALLDGTRGPGFSIKEHGAGGGGFCGSSREQVGGKLLEDGGWCVGWSMVWQLGEGLQESIIANAREGRGSVEYWLGIVRGCRVFVSWFEGHSKLFPGKL